MRAISKDELKLIAGAGSNTGGRYTSTTGGSTGGGYNGTQTQHGETVHISAHKSYAPPQPPISDYTPSSQNTPPGCLTPQNPHNGANESVIENHEQSGPPVTKGYQPLGPGGVKAPKSGVTIGGGVDLGYQTAAVVGTYGLTQADLATLTPFFGKIGSNADTAVTANGLPNISYESAVALTNGAFNYATNQVAATYNNNTTTGVSFFELPSSVQTVLVDLQYWLGDPSNGTTNHWQNTFNSIAAGNFAETIAQLNHFFNNGTTNRLKDDARMIQDSINNGEIPSKTTTGRC